MNVGSLYKRWSTQFVPQSTVAEPQGPTERHTESLAQPTGRRFKAKDAKVPLKGGGTANASSRASDAARPLPAPAALGQSPGYGRHIATMASTTLDTSCSLITPAFALTSAFTFSPRPAPSKSLAFLALAFLPPSRRPNLHASEVLERS